MPGGLAPRRTITAARARADGASADPAGAARSIRGRCSDGSRPFRTARSYPKRLPPPCAGSALGDGLTERAEVLQQGLDVGLDGLGGEDPRPQVGGTAQSCRRQPALAGALQRRLQTVLVRVERSWWQPVR